MRRPCKPRSCDDWENVKKQCVGAQKVSKSKIQQLDVNELFINGKPFPNNNSAYVINESTVIVGTNPAPSAFCSSDSAPIGACIMTPPTPTPGTPSGGVFRLGQSFSGKILFYGVKGAELDLAGLILNNDNDVALEFVNCSQIWVHGGSVNSLNDYAIKICSSTNLCLSRINTADTKYGVYVQNSYDVNLKNWYFDRITGYAIKFDCSNYVRITNITVKEIRAYNGDAEVSNNPTESLFIANNSEMIFINNCALYNIQVDNATGIKSVMSVKKCFDVKISRISILTTFYNAIENADLTVALLDFVDSGSINMNSFILDGDYIQVFGQARGLFNCIRLQRCNNTFLDDILITDNSIYGDATNNELRFAAVYLDSMETFILEHSRICTNSIFVKPVDVPNTNMLVSLSSLHGTSNTDPFLNGNWYIYDNVCNQNLLYSFNQIEKSAVYGCLIEKLDKSFVIEDTATNNHGNDLQISSQVTTAQNINNLPTTLFLRNVDFFPPTGTVTILTNNGPQTATYSGLQYNPAALLAVTSVVPFTANVTNVVTLLNPVLRGPSYVAGVSISADVANIETSIMVDNVSANQNRSDSENGVTVGVFSAYNNTIFNEVETVGNKGGIFCAGMYVAGANILIDECQSNSNDSENGDGNGLYAGDDLVPPLHNIHRNGMFLYQNPNNKLNNLTVEETLFNSNKDCGVKVIDGRNMSFSQNTFNSNRIGLFLYSGVAVIEENYLLGNHQGMLLEQISNSSIEENNVQNSTLNGIEIINGENTSLIRNTCKNNQQHGFHFNGGSVYVEDNLAVGNLDGFHCHEIENSTIQENTSQNNRNGYVDDSNSNSYFTNKAVKNTVSSFENVVSKFSWYNFNADGSFTLNPLSGPGPLNAFSNISRV